MGIRMDAGSYSEVDNEWLIMGLMVAEGNPAPGMPHFNSTEDISLSVL